jgi:hypothetical protein
VVPKLMALMTSVLDDLQAHVEEALTDFYAA